MDFETIQGIKVPEIGLGTYKLYGRECYETLRKALDLGYTHIDTAQMYENEAEIGEAIKISGRDREELFITTKIWHTDLQHDDVLQTVEDSLRDLDTPYLDLLLIHWPNPDVPLERTFEAMMTLRDQGKAINIGVSNFNLALMKQSVEELRIPLFCNQLEFHPFLVPEAMLDYSYDHDFMVTAYAPLARGRVFEEEIIRNIAEEHGKSPAQVALRWLIEQENVVAIPKATSEEHLKANLDIYDFSLSDEEFELIDSLNRSERIVNPDFAPAWEEE